MFAIAPGGAGAGDYADVVAATLDDLALPAASDVLGNRLGGLVAQTRRDVSVRAP